MPTARYEEIDITWQARDRDGAASALCFLRRSSPFQPSRTSALGPLGLGRAPQGGKAAK